MSGQNYTIDEIWRQISINANPFETKPGCCQMAILNRHLRKQPNFYYNYLVECDRDRIDPNENF